MQRHAPRARVIRRRRVRRQPHHQRQLLPPPHHPPAPRRQLRPHQSTSRGAAHHPPPSLPVTIVRPNGIFGPNDNTHFPRLKQLLRRGLFSLKVGDGRALVDWVFIDNLTHALLMAAVTMVRSGGGGGGGSSSSSRCLTVHVSDEDPREMNHLFCTFAQGLGYTPPSLRISVALLSRVAAVMQAASRITAGIITPMLTPSEAYKAGTHMVFSTDDARRSIAWQPVVSYTDGIRHTPLTQQAKP